MPTIAPTLMGFVQCVTLNNPIKVMQCIFTYLARLLPRAELVLQWTSILERIPIITTENGGTSTPRRILIPLEMRASPSNR